MRLKNVLAALIGAGAAAASAQAVTQITNTIQGGYVDITQSGGVYHNLGDDGSFTYNTAIGNALLPAGVLNISNNGAVSWGNTNGTGFTNGAIPSGNLAGGQHALAVYWDDLYTYDRGVGNPADGVWTYETDQVLYVTWRVGHIEAGGQATIQLQVFKTGPVLAQFVYPSVDFGNGGFNNGANATVGYQAAGTGNDFQWSFNNAGSIPNGTVLSILDPNATNVAIVDTIPGTFREVTSAAFGFGLGDDNEVNISTGGNLLLRPGTHRITNNGAIAWNNTNGTSFVNDPLPSGGLANGAQALAPYWDDLWNYGPRPFPEGADNVYVEETSGAVYITWALGHISAGGQAKIQLQVFKGGPIYAQYIYKDVDFGNGNYNLGASATIGYQSGGAAGATQWSFNESNAVRPGVVLSLIDPPAPACKADYNHDGEVNSNDVSAFLNQWFLEISGCP